MREGLADLTARLVVATRSSKKNKRQRHEAATQLRIKKRVCDSTLKHVVLSLQQLGTISEDDVDEYRCVTVLRSDMQC